MNPDIILGNLSSGLNDLIKRAEKHLVTVCVAQSIASRSNSHKQKVKRAKNKAIHALKSQSNTFEKQFSNTTKGKWVDSAMLAFSNNKDQIDDI